MKTKSVRFATTLNRIRANSLCHDGWTKLLKHLRKTRADGEPLPLVTILDSNGIDDALWCLCALDGIDKIARLFAADCAARALRFDEKQDLRSRRAVEVARKFAHGKATATQLAAAAAAACDAAAAAWDASAAAWDASASASAWDASAAAVAVAAVAWAAACNAASTAAAAAVAWAAACDASACCAAWDASACRAAWDAEREWQAARLRLYLTSARIPTPVPLPPLKRHPMMTKTD